MQKPFSPGIILWAMLLTILMPANAQNVLVLQLPDPCFTSNTRFIPVQNTQPFQLTISPNPTKDEITLTVSHKETLGLIKIHITDIKGVAIANTQYFSSHQKWINTLDISHLPKGIYVVSAHRNGQLVSQKIIKQ
jgi:hypothetical protein